RAEITPQRLRVVDAAMSVVQIHGVEAVLAGEQPHDHAHLAMEAASVGDGRKHPAVGAQPALHARENRDGVFDVFEDMSENDVVEGPTGLVLLEERTLDLDGRVTLAERS